LRFIGFAILIPIFGLLGAALATAISLVIVTVVLNVLCRRWIGVDPSVLILLRKPAEKFADRSPIETKSRGNEDQ
jgi:O-antigen/teichoic acid export membrane protein